MSSDSKHESNLTDLFTLHLKMVLVEQMLTAVVDGVCGTEQICFFLPVKS